MQLRLPGGGGRKSHARVAGLNCSRVQPAPGARPSTAAACLCPRPAPPAGATSPLLVMDPWTVLQYLAAGGWGRGLVIGWDGCAPLVGDDSSTMLAEKKTHRSTVPPPCCCPLRRRPAAQPDPGRSHTATRRQQDGRALPHRALRRGGAGGRGGLICGGVGGSGARRGGGAGRAAAAALPAQGDHPGQQGEAQGSPGDVRVPARPLAGHRVVAACLQQQVPGLPPTAACPRTPPPASAAQEGRRPRAVLRRPGGGRGRQGGAPAGPARHRGAHRRGCAWPGGVGVGMGWGAEWASRRTAGLGARSASSPAWPAPTVLPRCASPPPHRPHRRVQRDAAAAGRLCGGRAVRGQPAAGGLQPRRVAVCAGVPGAQ